MHWERLLEGWNSRYGDKLSLSPEVMRWTFGAQDAGRHFVVSTPYFKLLCKLEDKALRLHLPLPTGNTDVEEAVASAIEILRVETRKFGVSEIFFGGGDRHLFPGVPLHKDLGHWLKWFEDSGPEVMDFGGQIDALVEKSEKTELEGELRNANGPRETEELVAFVQKEFPGRWSREVTEDFRNNLLNFYFGYYINGELSGYLRLYGWTPDYRGPAINFARAGVRLAGLGPIGVASLKRGLGLGGQMLKASWDILEAKKCSTVRIDWTTETLFYHGRGLEIVQTYQPAVLKL